MHRPLKYYARAVTRNRWALSARTGATAPRARAAGTIAAATALTLLVMPVTASALETSTYPLAITVRISNGVDAAALAGATITVRTTDGDDTVVGTGITGADGTVDLEVEGTEGSYVADADWSGAPGDLEQTSSRTEFWLGSEDPVDISLWGTYGTISGVITAIAEGHAVTDLSGGALVIASGGSAVQRLSIAADGSFASGALPTSSSADYSLDFVPPAGYTLAADQPEANPPLELPRGTAQPSAIALARQFTVVPDDATPTPTPTSTSTPTVTPTPTETPSPDPTAPTPGSRPPLTVGTAGSLGGALDASSEDQLNALLRATKAGGYQPTLVNNGSHQMLGLAQQPTPHQALQLVGAMSPITDGLPGLTVNGISFATMDLDTLRLSLLNGRASQVNTDLAAKLGEIQERNVQIEKLSAALATVDRYRSLPAEDVSVEAAFTAATNAVRAAGIVHAFLTTSAQTGVPAATALAAELRDQVDAVATSQRLDMLRTQGLLTTRNEAFQTMSELLKKLSDSRSQIIGNMRSTPVSLGTMQWNGGAVTGSLDLTHVPNGEHHLILNFADAGVAVVANVTVQRGELAATGGQPIPAVGAGLGLLALGLVATIWSGLLRRRPVMQITTDKLK